MNSLISIRTNIFYNKEVKEGEETYNRHQELIMLVDKPKYTYSNEGEIVRERGLEELRFTVSEKGFEQLIEMLEKMKEVEPDELG
jgi:hypothetical protein